MQPQVPRNHAEPVLDEERHLRVEHPPVGSCTVRQEHGDAAAGVVVGEAASIELEVFGHEPIVPEAAAQGRKWQP